MRTASVIAAGAMLALLLNLSAAAARQVPVEITAFGPFSTGMAIDKAKAAAPRAKLQDCGEIADERQCLAVKAGVFNEPATIYAVLNEPATHVEKIVAQFDPYRTHRRAFRCIRLSEKVFALLVVVYGSEYKQSYDEDRRPLPAVAWDGAREGRLIFSTNCRTQDEGTPTISVLPLKNPDAPPAPQVADDAAAAQSGRALASARASGTPGVFEQGVDTGLSIDLPEPKPDTAPRLPVTESPLPAQQTASQPEPKAQPSQQIAAQPEPKAEPPQQVASVPEPKAQPRREPHPAVVPAATPPAGPAERATELRPVTEELRTTAPNLSKSPVVEPKPAGASPAPSRDPRPVVAAAPKAKTVPLRAAAGQQVARLTQSDDANPAEPPPMDAPEPFTYADDDETDDGPAYSDTAVPPTRSQPPRRTASLSNPAPVVSSPRSPTPRPAPAVAAADTAGTASDLANAAGRYPVRPIAYNAADTSTQPARAARASVASTETPITAPKIRRQATRAPVSLLFARRDLHPASPAPRSTDRTPDVTRKGGSAEPVIEIRQLSTLPPDHGSAPKKPAAAVVPESTAAAVAGQGPDSDKSTHTSAVTKAKTATPSSEPASVEPDTRMQAWAKAIVPKVSSLPDTRVTFDRGDKSKPKPESDPKPASKVADRSPAPAKVGKTPALPTAAAPVVAAKPASKATPTPAPTVTPTPRTHVVVAGETLYSIARRYKANLKALARINNIPPSNLIKWGQTLIIPGPAADSAPAKSEPDAGDKSDRARDPKSKPAVRDRSAPTPTASPRRAWKAGDERLSLAAEPPSKPRSKATFEP